MNLHQIGVMSKMVDRNRRVFIVGISSLGITALAGCSDDGGSRSVVDSLTILDNEIDSSGSVTTSSLTIENTADEELDFTLSGDISIGPDGLYGKYSDEQRTTIAANGTTVVTLNLYDRNELTEVANHEIQNGYFNLTYYINGEVVSDQEFREISSQYVSFRVRYDGSWQGALGSEGEMRSISGQGDSHLPVTNDAIIVSGNAQKQDDSSATLTVQILVDGKVISEQSTSAPYGVAQVGTDIN